MHVKTSAKNVKSAQKLDFLNIKIINDATKHIKIELYFIYSATPVLEKSKTKKEAYKNASII